MPCLPAVELGGAVVAGFKARAKPRGRAKAAFRADFAHIFIRVGKQKGGFEMAAEARLVGVGEARHLRAIQKLRLLV